MIPELGSPGEGHGNLLQYSSLKNPMDRGVLWAVAHKTAKSQTCLEQLGTDIYTLLCIKWASKVAQW